MVRRRPGSGARRPEAADVTMERSATADIAKTIGIILVVIGHYNPADAPEWYHLANRFIYAFHMLVSTKLQIDLICIINEFLRKFRTDQIRQFSSYLAGKA